MEGMFLPSPNIWCELHYSLINIRLNLLRVIGRVKEVMLRNDLPEGKQNQEAKKEYPLTSYFYTFFCLPCSPDHEEKNVIDVSDLESTYPRYQLRNNE